MTLTQLELTVLLRVYQGIDPWRGMAGAVGSRSVSQAMQRLRRKGACTMQYAPGVLEQITPAGTEALRAAGKIPEPAT